MNDPVIGQMVCCTTDDFRFSCSGQVVGFWPADEQPPGDELVTFTNMQLTDKLAQAMWKPKKWDRIAIRKANGSCVIIPMTRRMVFREMQDESCTNTE